MTIDEYNRKLAEMQTQMKELVPDPFVDRYLDDALEKFGKKWYSRGYEDAKSEIVHCKDCRYWPYKSMPYSSYEKYTEHYPQCFDAKSNDYCYLAKRDETKLKRRAITANMLTIFLWVAVFGIMGSWMQKTANSGKERKKNDWQNCNVDVLHRRCAYVCRYYASVYGYVRKKE